MLAAIPTHLDENNHQRIKKMAKTYRLKVEEESTLIRGKMQHALSAINTMQKRIRQLEAELRKKDELSLTEALTIMQASSKEELTQLSDSLTQQDMFEETAADNTKEEDNNATTAADNTKEEDKKELEEIVDGDIVKEEENVD